MKMNGGEWNRCENCRGRRMHQFFGWWSGNNHQNNHLKKKAMCKAVYLDRIEILNGWGRTTMERIICKKGNVPKTR